MNQNTLITQGLTVDQLLSSVRDIVRDEIASIPTPQTAKLFLTLSEASELAGLSKSSVYRLTSEKKIPHLKPGGRLLFNRADLIAWLEESKQEIISNQG